MVSFGTLKAALLQAPSARLNPFERGGRRIRLLATTMVRNEREHVPGMLRNVGPQVDGIVALDDGSSDGTDRLLEQSPYVVELLRNQLDSLESGAPPAQIGLPEFAAQAAGHGILRRLIAYWGNPGKRRFPRRRQSYRAELCCGLDNLWQVFRETPGLPVETSHWMVINESPDGYAVMHVSGNPGAIAAGDIAAIRTETSDRWQTCIVRWAISENQEHLELGLQILASKAIPATLTLQLPGKEETEKLPVLILPSVPPLRPLQMLVVPPGVLDTEPKHLVLMIEKRNLELREVRNTALDEQNSQIEIFSIEPDSYPT